MNRQTLLRRVVEPSPHGRVHDMECECVMWYCEPDGSWFSQAFNGCPVCHGSGRVSKRLSRREAHAITTWMRMEDKVARRAMHEYVQSQRRQLKALMKRPDWQGVVLSKARQCGMRDTTRAIVSEWRW